MSDCCGGKRNPVVWWALAALLVGAAVLAVIGSRGRGAQAPGPSSASGSR